MKTSGKHHMSGLLALLLFGVFAVCVLFVLLTGARAYRALTARDQSSYAMRTCVQYLAAKVRQAPATGAVTVARLGEGAALCIEEDIDGESYMTCVYCYDGWLRELFCAADGDINPEDGERVLEASALDLTLEDGLLSMAVTGTDGTATVLRLHVRSGEGAAP